MQSTANSQERLASLPAIEVALIAAGNLIGFAVDEAYLVTIVVSLAFFALRKIRTGKFSRRTPADYAIVGLIVMAILSVFISADTPTTLTAVSRLLASIALFYALANAAQSGISLRHIVLALASIGAAFAVVGITLIPKNELLGPLQAIVPQLAFTTLNPNILASFLAAILPVAISVLLWDWARLGFLQRAILLVASATMGAVIMATVSRASIVNMVIALAIVGWFFRPKFTTMSLAGFFLGSAIALAGWRDLLLSNFYDTIILPELTTRLEIWNRATYMLQDFAFTGVGMGNFGRIADLFYPFFLSAPGKIPHAHNVYLQVGIDLGILGLIAWLVIVMVMLHLAFNLHHRSLAKDQPMLAALTASIFASQVAMLLHGIIDAPLWNTGVALIVWALWGVLMLGDTKQLEIKKGPSVS